MNHVLNSVVYMECFIRNTIVLIILVNPLIKIQLIELKVINQICKKI